ncbi:MAG: hypothetical protein OSA40_01295 [Phycisphaerales bacterium]|jgi:hypothetical protein|nr:hypothetical protein [Phycisphaerales bacterium]
MLNPPPAIQSGIGAAIPVGPDIEVLAEQMNHERSPHRRFKPEEGMLGPQHPSDMPSTDYQPSWSDPGIPRKTAIIRDR